MGGKHVQNEASGLNVNQSHAGSTWSIFHVLKYHKWRYVRKKSPQKKEKNETPDNDSPPPDASRSVERKDAEKGHAVEEKPSKSGGTKHSVKARIKALVTDDKRKKKGKHHRTASVPQLDCHEEPLEEDPLAGVVFTKGSNDLEAKDPSKHCEQQIGDDRTVDEKLDIAQQSLAEQKLTEEEELETDASESESKEALEALNIINLNKESLMKILQNQSSPMVHHFHIEHGPDGKIRKTGSFRSPDPSSREEFGLLKFKSMKESLPQSAEYRKDGFLRRSRSAMTEKADKSSPSSVQLLKNSGESKKVSSVSRFKGLKKKIKQVLIESRKDKKRIAMDAVLHKVPPGNKFSKDAKKEVSEHLRNPVLSGDGWHSPKSSLANKPQHIKRTSSLNNSMDKYCQLYEATNKDINNHGSERERPKSRTEETSPPKTSQKNLSRNFSLPDLLYFSYQNEDSCKAFSASIKTAAESTDRAKHSLDEKKGVEDNSKESRVQENSVEAVGVNSLSRDQMESTPAASSDGNAEKDLHIDDAGGLGVEDGTSQHERDTVRRRKPSLELEELNSVFKPDLGIEEDITIPARELETNQQQKSIMDTTKMTERSNDTGKVEIPSKKVDDVPRLRVEENSRGEFQFVKDVLELSGFSGTEALGEWHDVDQPLDPCMYDEMDGYLVLEPECCENEGANSHQLVLFDVINEVLMEIYERACSYIPRRLSYVCHIRPLPRGQHVLEEVWEEVRWFLSFKPEPDQLVEYGVAKDLSKNDGWMNLQSDSECVGLELESLIFDDILDEAIWE